MQNFSFQNFSIYFGKISLSIFSSSIFSIFPKKFLKIFSISPNFFLKNFLNFLSENDKKKLLKRERKDGRKIDHRESLLWSPVK